MLLTGYSQGSVIAPAVTVDDPEPGKRRSKNLVRRSDYIGSWMVRQPGPDLTRLRDDVDQPCWDPVTLAADADPNPPPIHRHSGFWQDPRVTQLGRRLGRVLTGRA